MTSATDTRPATGQVQQTSRAAEQIPAKPTREQVLASYEAIGLRRKDGEALLDWLNDKVMPACRENPNGTYYVKTHELKGRIYRALDAVMAHGQAPAPGSPHALTEAHVLDPTQGEFGIRHDMRRGGELQHCHITVTRNAI